MSGRLFVFMLLPVAVPPTHFQFEIYIHLCFIQKKISTSRLNVFFLLVCHDACGVFDLEL